MDREIDVPDAVDCKHRVLAGVLARQAPSAQHRSSGKHVSNRMLKGDAVLSPSPSRNGWVRLDGQILLERLALHNDDLDGAVDERHRRVHHVQGEGRILHRCPIGVLRRTSNDDSVVLHSRGEGDDILQSRTRVGYSANQLCNVLLFFFLKQFIRLIDDRFSREHKGFAFGVEMEKPVYWSWGWVGIRGNTEQSRLFSSYELMANALGLANLETTGLVWKRSNWMAKHPQPCWTLHQILQKTLSVLESINGCSMALFSTLHLSFSSFIEGSAVREIDDTMTPSESRRFWLPEI